MVVQSTEKLLGQELSLDTNLIKERKQMINNLDSSGYKLWNIMFIKYKECVQSTVPWKIKFKKMGILKYFACMLLSIHSLLVIDESVKLRALKCFLRFYYESIDENDETYSEKLHHHLETYCSYIEKHEIISTDFKSEYQSIKIELSVLDMQSAFMINDIPMAKFYEKKANLVFNCHLLKQRSIVNICRLIYNASLKLSNENQNLDAMYFLEQSFFILEKLTSHKLEESILSPRKKLQIAILSLQTQNCINLQTEEHIPKAEHLLKLLHSLDKNNLDCLKLKIKLLERNDAPKSTANEELMKFIISMAPDTALINNLLKFLNTYSKKEPSIAYNGANYIFANKIKFQDKEGHEIGENLFISLIWMITSQLRDESPKEKIDLTRQLLDVSERKFIFKLKNDTTGSVNFGPLGRKK